MSDQPPTPQPDEAEVPSTIPADVPDETPFRNLPAAVRQRITDLATALVKGQRRLDDSRLRVLYRRWELRRAWFGYQQHFEDDEPTRERNARMAASHENTDIAEQPPLIPEAERQRLRRERDHSQWLAVQDAQRPGDSPASP